MCHISRIGVQRTTRVFLSRCCVYSCTGLSTQDLHRWPAQLPQRGPGKLSDFSQRKAECFFWFNPISKCQKNKWQLASWHYWRLWNMTAPLPSSRSKMQVFSPNGQEVGTEEDAVPFSSRVLLQHWFVCRLSFLLFLTEWLLCLLFV